MCNSKMRLVGLAVGTVLCGCAGILSAADFGFKRHYSDNMVLQRDKPAIIRGAAQAGARIDVMFAGQTKTATVDADGEWRVALDPMPASRKGRTLSVRSSANDQPILLQNVVVGDVILVARQTSIDSSLGSGEDGKTAAKEYNVNPNFRVISIETVPSLSPQRNLVEAATDGWRIVDQDTALDMNAAAFYMGRDIAASADVPLGIMDVNMGPAFPVSWLSREELEKTQMLYGRTDVPGQLARFDHAVEVAATNGVVEPSGKSSLTSDFEDYALAPAAGYNAVLNPLKGTSLKALILQLGNDYPYMVYADIEQSENPFDRDRLNIAYIQTYDTRKVGFRMEPVTLPRVPRVWRETLGDEDLPLGLILPPASDLNTLGQHHREMRELQRLMAEDNPNVGVILPGYDYHRFSAQPADDKLLAARCLNWLEGAVYNKPGVTSTGPLFERIDCNFNEATVIFKQGTANGLKAEGGALDTFEVAGIEGDYVPVTARIEGETIRLESDEITRITRVRYNWNSHPDQKLVNAAGLPAIPFRSEMADYDWFVRNEEDDLPLEYYTPANEWPQSDVTLVNGQMKTVGYDHFTGWIGPAGFRTGPFGPNMGVRRVLPGSPADGQLLVGDVIYSANGNMLGDKAWEVMAAAVTESETREKQGKLVLGLRRDGRNLDIELTLEVMGTYSPTAPYDCPKTEKIISQLEDWAVANGAKRGFLNYGAVFLLATGNPELQGYVRRIVYDMIKGKDPNRPIDPRRAGKSWYNSEEAFLLGEYYLATGDENVLPHLKHACDRLAATQNPLGGWRHNYPGGETYGLIPNAGLPGMMGMCFAREAGLDIDMDAYRRGIEHFAHNRTETGFLIYGVGPLCERETPVVFEPSVMMEGKMDSYNGGLACASILMRFAGRNRAAHLSSLISAFAWNNTFHGHGGNFWNNFWTPLAAHQHGKDAFINFWKHHRWYRECNRMYDGSLIENERGRSRTANGVVLVAPRKRIQIVGAPTSPFSTNAPAALKPALDAYRKKDYAKSQKLADALMNSGTVGKDDVATVSYLVRAADDIQKSITADITRINQLCEDGQPETAATFIAGLKGVLPAGDDRIASIEKMIASSKPAKRSDVKHETAEKSPEAVQQDWVRLVSEVPASSQESGPEIVNEPEASVWNMLVVEDGLQAPENWMDPGFDDAAWQETNLPISWRMYHTALFRTTFDVEDKERFDGLRFYAWLFRQQAIAVYLNGELVAKVNNLERKTKNVQAILNESALRHLKDGENTLAVTTRHNWRWGMLFMHVYNDGFDFNLDARIKQ